MDATLDSRVRALIYDGVMKTGHMPAFAEIASVLSLPLEEVRAAAQRLAGAHMLVLQRETGEVLMANPFSAVPTPFLVRAGGVDYFANCIWDSFGIPPMLKRDALIHASCSDCGEAMMLEVKDGQLTPAEGIVHFALPAKQWWDDIVFT